MYTNFICVLINYEFSLQMADHNLTLYVKKIDYEACKTASVV
jgi:hypothetical protein